MNLLALLRGRSRFLSTKRLFVQPGPTDVGEVVTFRDKDGNTVAHFDADGTVAGFGAGGGGAAGLPAATTFTTETAPNVIYPGNPDVAQMVSDDITLSVRPSSSENPWLIIDSSGSQLMLGNGSVDLDGMVAVYFAQGQLQFALNNPPESDSIVISVAGDLKVDSLRVNHFVRFSGPGAGPILVAPDSSHHRITVANDGTLSTEPVT